VTDETQNGAVEYGADELAAIAEVLGAQAFPGVDTAYAELGEAAQESALRSARRSLLARGVLTIDEEGILNVVPPHSVLFRVALAPALVVNAEHRRADSMESRSYYALPAVGVEHAVSVGRVHRLAQIDPTTLLERLVAFVGLESRPSGDQSEFEVDVETLNRALADSAGTELPDEAKEFRDALETLQSTSYVRSLYGNGRSIVGGELRWIDTGENGLWLVEPGADDPDRVLVKRAEGSELFGELLSYLPGQEAQPAAT
jgi:hypothetical protein